MTGDADLGHERGMLAAWLAEWRIARTLDDGDGMPDAEKPPAAAAPPPATAAQDGCDGPPDTWGEIRLLHPWLTPGAGRPVYVAAVEGPHPALATVVPFGPFALPATPEELLLAGRRPPPLRVLCLWNRALWPLQALQPSWRAGVLSRAARADLQSFLLRIERGTRLTSRLAGRVGPRLIHPADPRRTYQQRERALLDCAIEAASGGHAIRGGAIPFVPPGGNADAGPSLRMAAEGSSAYGHARRWRIGSTDLVLVVCRNGDEVEVSVEDGAGQRSRALDGGILVLRIGSHVIENGQCRMPCREFADGFIPCDRQGVILALRPL